MKIFYIFFIFLTFLNTNLAIGLQDAILPTPDNQIGVEDNGVGTINDILIFVKDFIFTILWIIAVGVFLYFGFKLITSRGNQEEMQKTLVAFVYAIAGLAVIPLAYTLVYLITTYKF